MANEKLIQVVDLCKSYHKLDVIKHISVDFSKNEVVSIIGPSGSGKSTLLRCATLLETMDGGSLSYMGKSAVTDVNGAAVYAPSATLKEIRGYFGLVFQNFNLFPHYNVLKNIAEAPMLIQKRPKDEVYETARELLKKMGLSDKEDAYPYQLSGGQQQRVSIARALAMRPKILFFDEPTSALDPELTGEILKVIRDLASEHMTMVIVTHEMAFARDVSDHVIFMDGGVIIEQGKPNAIINNPAHERTIQFLSRFN